MKNKKTYILFYLSFIYSLSMYAQKDHIDIIHFGNSKSEQKHNLRSEYSEVITGGLNETSRRFLPEEIPSWEGGKAIFEMEVDAEKQNYFSVRCWGSEADNSILLLFIEGKQIGYRHLGDINLLHRGNGGTPFYNRYYYYTLPLPEKYTAGKKKVTLEIRAYGNIWDYGETFEAYQKNLTEPTIAIYTGYTHTEPLILPSKNEKQGRDELLTAPVRQAPGAEVIEEIKTRVNSEIEDLLNKNTPLSQMEAWLLADAYTVAWTKACNNSLVITKLIEAIDHHYIKYLTNPAIIYTDPGVYNGDWMTTALFARSIRKLWNESNNTLSHTVLTTSRKDIWGELLKASLDYGITHRRHYTNQSMIIDMAIYECNRTLMLMDTQKALPEYQTLRYLYESIGLAPWLGKETASGPEKPLGDNYWQLTQKGLTKELGFTGYYGEVLDWIIKIYEATGVPGIPDSGDPKIKAQLIKMMDARNYFRYPALDNDGYRCFRAEAVVGWRDGNHYPGDILYGDRGIAWDASPLMTAAATLHPRALGAAQQMMKDNQLFSVMKEKNAMRGIRVTQSLLHFPQEYELIKQQSLSDESLPMNMGMPDFVFSDEEDGVVAIKHGEEILYASLYWRARMAINNLAKVHYITPFTDRLANIHIQSEFTPGGMTYVRADRTNIEWIPVREFYPEISSAHAGDELPIAKVPDNVEFTPGQENSYAGKADFYTMHYGNYLVGMNCTPDKTYQLEIPKGYKSAVDLTEDKKQIFSSVVEVAPMSTVVIYIK